MFDRTHSFSTRIAMTAYLFILCNDARRKSADSYVGVT